MLILLDCRPLQQEEPDSEKSRFIFACIKRLSEQQSVEWLFLADRALGADWLQEIFRHRWVMKRTLPGKGGWKLWYDWQIPLAVKRYKPDLVMTTAGIAVSRIRVSQCVWMPERADMKGVVKKSYSRIYLKRLIRTLRQAQAIFSFSQQDKDFLISLSAVSGISEKIFVMPPAAGEYPSIGSGERERIKGKYTEGKEYFFTSVRDAGQAEIVALLKAFSLFKKRQRSNMQLVLAGKDPGSDRELADQLATYKYRQDIHWAGLPSEEELLRLAVASYAIVFPFDRGSLGTCLLDAWKAGVPVITTAAASLPEIAGDAVLYVQPGDPASLAAQLMLIYKDELLRNNLIAKGAQQGRSFSRDRSAATLWSGISAINN